MTIKQFKDALEQNGFEPVRAVPGLYRKGEWPFFTANLYQSPQIFAQKSAAEAVQTVPVETKKDVENALNLFE